MNKKLLLALILPLVLFSQNLDELIEISLVNKQIDSSIKNLNSIEKKYESVKNDYLPSVSLGLNYTDVSNETSSNPNNKFTTSASISYNVYDGGKKDLRFQSYESQIEAVENSIVFKKNQVALTVTTHYYNYLSNIAQKDAKQKEIEQLNAQYIRLERFLTVGTTTVDELDKINSRVERANLELHEIELNLQTILHKLEYILGKKVDIQKGSKINFFESETRTRADIKALEYDMKNRLILSKQEKTVLNPNVTLQNTYSHYENNYNNSGYDNGVDDQNKFMVNVSWKIFDFNSTKKAYESSHKSYLSLKSNYEYEKNRADVDQRLAKKSYDISKLKIKSAKASLKAANSTYEFARKKYENGLIDNVSFLEALTEKYDAISSVANAEYDLEVKKAEVVFYSGKNLWEFVK